VTFHDIFHHVFERIWNETPIPCQDVLISSVPRSLDACGALGLILHYLNSTMLEVSLSQIFAIVPTTVSCYITFTLGILLFTLKCMKDAWVQWPVGNVFEENSNLILARHPLLIGAFGSMDGLNLPDQTSQDQEVENATFNSWLQEHFISSVFAFGANGENSQTTLYYK
jgi:ABC-type arginine/histidine transport system permease subunit